MTTWLTIIGIILILIALLLWLFIKFKFLKKIEKTKNDEFGITKDQNKVYTKLTLYTIVVLIFIAGIVLTLSKLY